MKTTAKHFPKCCNPYSIKGHRKNTFKELRLVTPALKSLHPSLELNNSICGTCRLKITKSYRNTTEQSSELKSDEFAIASTSGFREESSHPAPSLTQSQDLVSKCSQDSVIKFDQDSNYVLTGQSISSLSLSLDDVPTASDLSDGDVAIQQINGVLRSLNLPSLKRISQLTDSYILSVIDEVHQSLKTKFEMIRPTKTSSIPDDISSNTIIYENDGFEVLSQLKQVFRNPHSNRQQKMKILTLAPISWSARKIEKFFECSYHVARQAKILVEENGIMSAQTLSVSGHTIPVETVNLVTSFYTSDEISKILPGKKDFVSVRDSVSNVRKHEQKRLVLGNLREIYEEFKKENPSIKIGFSKFAELRPKQCVLAGCSGTHTICVCTYHQNMKLIFENCSIAVLTKDSSTQLSNCYDAMALMVCKDPSSKCYFSECTNCTGITKVKEILLESFGRSEIDEISFKQWVSTDRTKLLTITLSIDEFIEETCKQLEQLLCHDFIAKQQSSYLRSLKNQLDEGEFVVICDFAQNYAFVAQDAAQGFYWNNEQATLHPMVIYYRSEGKLEHRSICIISDCMKHDNTAVYLFQTVLLKYLKDKYTVRKIFYYSDGAPQQYKNRNNFINLYYHFEDFDVRAEWNFFATAHGKGACDGLAGTVKRLASRASLQLSANDQILNPRSLYEWCKVNIVSVEFFYTTQSDYDTTASFLTQRHNNARRAPQTQQIHCIIPGTDGKILTRRYSASTVANTCKIIK